MIRFKFQVGKAFFDRGHRITIPRSQVRYDKIRAEGLDKDLIVIFPRGEQTTARFSDSTAGRGPYYYIDIRGMLPDYLKRNDHLIVELSNNGRSSQVTLTEA